MLNILVIGTGMYVTGRGTSGYGTVIPALLECNKLKRISLGDIYIAGASKKGVSLAKAKIDELSNKMKVKISPYYFPRNAESNPRCYKEAIKKISKPAAALVVVPDNLHREIAADAIDAGLHTLVVKPLVPTLDEANNLIGLQNRNKVYCAVEFHKRFDAANLKLKDVIQNGEIGEPLYFFIEYSQRKNIPFRHFKKWVKSTNAFQYLGIHYVDIIYFATEARPLRVTAIGQKGWLLSKGIDSYDLVIATIEWEMPGGRRFNSQILTSWIDPENTSAMSDQRIKVIGTKGRFDSDQKNRGIKIVTDEKGIEELNPYFCSAFGRHGNLYYRGYGIDSIHQFLEDVVRIEKGEFKIEDLEDNRPTFKQALVSTAVLEAVNQSLKDNGSWITIKKEACYV